MATLWFLVPRLNLLLSVLAVSGEIGSGPTYYKETVLEAESLTADRISLYVHSVIPGNITWRSADTVHLRVSVTTITDSIEDIGLTHIDLQSNTSHVTLYIGAKQQSVAAVSGTGSRPLYSDIWTVLAIWTLSIMHNWKHVSLVLIIVLVNGVWRGLADDMGYEITSNRKRVSVEIKVPRRFRFGDVYLRIDGGMIRVDLTGGSRDVSNFTCATGSIDADGCSGCCHGNGYCDNDVCTCADGYDPATYCKSKKRTDIFFSHPLDPRLVESALPNGDTVLILEQNNPSHNNGFQSIKTYKEYTDAMVDRHLLLNIFSGEYSDAIAVEFDASGIVSEIQVEGIMGFYIRFIRKCDTADDLENSSGVTAVASIVTVAVCSEEVNNQIEDVDSDNRNDIVGDIGNISPARHTRREGKRNKYRRKKRKRKKSRKNKSSSFVDIPITVQRCGSDVSVEHVTVKLTPDPNNSSSVTLEASKDSSTGKFSLRLPNVSAPVPESVFSNKCKHAMDRGASICSQVNIQILTSGCGSFSRWYNGVHTSGNNEAVGNLTNIVDLCVYVSDVILTLCDIFIDKHSHTVNGTCNSVFSETVNIFNYDSFHLYTKASFSDGKITEGPRKNVSLRSFIKFGNGIFIEDDKPIFAIKSVSVLPKDPIPQDIYQVELTYECATSQTVVAMNVTGSDLYQNHVTCHGVSSCQCCVLHVAGATDAVIDHVTIHVTDPTTNTNISKDMIVRF